MRLRIRWVLPAICACTRTPAPPPPAASATTSASPPTLEAAAPPVHPERAFALPPDAACNDDLRCLVDHAYASDEKTRALALALFDATGDVAGTEHEQTMDGGFRGTLHIYPALPTGEARVQLERVVAAARDFDRFFAELRAKDAAAAPKGAPYRWRDLTFRFFRSASGPAGHEVPRTTPSAYADGPEPMPHDASDPIAFSLAYNVKGSLLGTETGVRETVFHEVFHMNDAAHEDWSSRALRADYAAILARCGAMNVACLQPYAPNDTKVRGGTYYAFEPNNGLSVREYAAELALRWYKEQRAVLGGERSPLGGRAFKCGPPENKRSWDALVKEFFAIDLVPPCP